MALLLFRFNIKSIQENHPGNSCWENSQLRNAVIVPSCCLKTKTSRMKNKCKLEKSDAESSDRQLQRAGNDFQVFICRSDNYWVKVEQERVLDTSRTLARKNRRFCCRLSILLKVLLMSWLLTYSILYKQSLSWTIG